MGSAASANITVLLRAWADGSPHGIEQLMPIVYGELHLGRAYMRRQRTFQALQTTALSNEAHLRLMGAEGLVWEDRAHFFAVVAQMMLRILVDATRVLDARVV